MLEKLLKAIREEFQDKEKNKQQKLTNKDYGWYIHST